ncbi:MAG: SulP family inorganic anion transporter [Tepidisphaeraceae bacterium]
MLDFFQKHSYRSKDDVLSGLTVALALVPEAVAFAFVAGVSPIVGLYSAIFMGLITACLGGRPGMISGATGAIAVVIVSLVARHGVTYLFPTMMLAGLVQITIGTLRLGKFIRMVPHSVMLGFVNGLAVVIFLAQFGSFKTVSDTGALESLRGPALAIMLALVGLTMLIIWLLPKITRAVPASLAAILIVTGLAVGLNNAAPASLAGRNQSHVVMTVGDMLLTNAKANAVRAAGTPAAMREVPASAGSISAGLPRPFFLDHALPPLNLQSLWIILPYALTCAGVGLIESLMTLTLIDEITETRGRSNKECIGQGLANLASGFFGGMGGCAMIGQSLINVNSGGRGRLSGITAGVCLLLFVLVLGPWIEQIPMAALVGVMFMVVIGTFEWSSVRLYGKMPTSDYLVMLLVTLYTVFRHDLATAVVLGVIVSALVFAWRHATHLFADIKLDEAGRKVYQLHGPLFFASVRSFKELFDPKTDPAEVVIDFYYSRVYDGSALEVIDALAERYRQAGKRLHLRHLSPECRGLLQRARDWVEVNIAEDPHYHVASDRLG